MEFPSWLSSGVVSCGVGHRQSPDPELLWLRYRLAATVLIGPLAWEPPYASIASLKRQKGKEKEKATRAMGSKKRLL